MLTQGYLRRVLDYDQETGIFRWRMPASHMKVGDEAGCLDSRGYRKIKIDRRIYSAHRLAWLWVTGKVPKHHIDHINRNPSDNSFSNLRLATASQNKHNTLLTKDNTSGVKGVGWNRRDSNWASRLRLNGKLVFFGYFSDKLDATIAFNYNSTWLIGEFVKLNPIPPTGYGHD